MEGVKPLADDLIKPMPHQIDAVQRLRNGNILCGGVGSGKSFTALLYFHDVECEAVVWSDGKLRGPLRSPKPLYIITTARKRDTKEWEAECARFTDFDIPITIDSWNNLHKYVEVEGAFFIFDEQRVVGSGSWTKWFQKVTRANRWILLSATPGDTWTDYIPVFVANGFYKNRSAFLRRHAVYSRYCTKYPRIERWLEVGYLESLRRRITVTMEVERNAKQHWLDVICEYDTADYRRVAADRWNIYEDAPIQDAAAACYLMRRVANSGKRMVSFRNGYSLEVDARSAEIFHLWNIRKKLIVFYNYDYELEALRETLDIFRRETNPGQLVGYAIAEWNGHKHEPIPECDSWIYLVQYAAGAEGWNCVETNAIAFYSQNYSYKTMTQAAGRIDRLNTPFGDLYYYTLKTRAPIDLAIEKALRAKRNFNEKLFIGSWKA